MTHKNEGSEAGLAVDLCRLNAAKWASFSTSKQDMLWKRRGAEQVIMVTKGIRVELSEAEQQGRLTGSVEWRRARSELGSDGGGGGGGGSAAGQ